MTTSHCRPNPCAPHPRLRRRHGPKHLKLRWGVLLPGLAVAGCGLVGLDDSEIVTYEVAAHKASCVGLFHTLCLQVREPGEEDYGNLFGTPRGFDFEWGIETVIEVKETPVEDPPADGSSIQRDLERVLQRTPVESGTTFAIRPPSAALNVTGPDGYSLFGEPVTIRCTSPAQCQALETARQSYPRLLLVLAHPPQAGEPLVVLTLDGCPEEYGPCGEGLGS